MTADVPTQQIIKAWLDDLSLLVKGDEEDLHDERLKIYLRMLAEEPLPGGAYSTASLASVARDVVSWPEYASLRARLMEWWSDNKPRVAPDIVLPGEERLSKSERAWLDFYRRERPKSDEYRRAHLDSLLRRYAWKAWEIIAAGRRQAHPAFEPIPAQHETANAG